MKRLLPLALTAFVISGCVTTVTPEQLANADYGTPPPENHQEMIKAKFQYKLKDPYSAQYIFEEPAKSYLLPPAMTTFPPTFGYRVCGMVNAKNSFGGYTGNSLFLAMFKNGELVALRRSTNENDMYSQIERENLMKACERTVE